MRLIDAFGRGVLSRAGPRGDGNTQPRHNTNAYKAGVMSCWKDFIEIELLGRCRRGIRKVTLDNSIRATEKQGKMNSKRIERTDDSLINDIR
ncbi:MAG: hypothetical protein WBA66_11920 [Xanthobacteraceae bacterium]